MTFSGFFFPSVVAATRFVDQASTWRMPSSTFHFSASASSVFNPLIVLKTKNASANAPRCSFSSLSSIYTTLSSSSALIFNYRLLLLLFLGLTISFRVRSAHSNIFSFLSSCPLFFISFPLLFSPVAELRPSKRHSLRGLPSNLASPNPIPKKFIYASRPRWPSCCSLLLHSSRSFSPIRYLFIIHLFILPIPSILSNCTDIRRLFPNSMPHYVYSSPLFYSRLFSPQASFIHITPSLAFTIA